MARFPVEKVLLVGLVVGGAIAVAIFTNLKFPPISRYPVGVALILSGTWNIASASVRARRYTADSLPLWRAVDEQSARRLLLFFGVVVVGGGVVRLLH